METQRNPGIARSSVGKSPISSSIRKEGTVCRRQHRAAAQHSQDIPTNFIRRADAANHSPASKSTEAFEKLGDSPQINNTYRMTKLRSSFTLRGEMTIGALLAR